MDGRSAVGCYVTTTIAVAASFANVVVIEPAKDNTIYSNGNSNGAGDAIFSGKTGNFGGGVVQRGLMMFDVAGAVPAGATVTSVSLTMHLVQASMQGAPSNHELHLVMQDWGEGMSNAFGGQGALPQAGDATWSVRFFPNSPWNNAGGTFVAVASASQTIGLQPGSYTFGSTPKLVADVQGWLDSPATNFGWNLTGQETVLNSAKRFGSRNNANAALRPMLAIEFDAPACAWDCGDGNGAVDTVDFLALLSQWGQVGTPCDFDGGGVSTVDFLDLLAHWGACP